MASVDEVVVDTDCALHRRCWRMNETRHRTCGSWDP
jgi:hypothetical protein